MCNEAALDASQLLKDWRGQEGTPSARLNGLLAELAKRFPEAHQPFRSDPPELLYLEAIDALLKKGQGA